MKKIFILAITLGLFAFGCGSSKNAAPEFKVYNNQVVIKAKVVEILPVKPDAKPPCNTHHCMAKVRILEVGETGPGYQGKVKPGDLIRVKFYFTLDGNSKKKLKKLKVGDEFMAPMTVMPKPGMMYDFSVSIYKKL